MAPQDDIAFLESFRDAIDRFLILGTAPTQDPVWGGSGLTKMKEAMQDPAFRALRQDILQTKHRAAHILEALGISCTFTQHPPPAVGGPVEKFPLFDLITDNQSLHTVDGSVFTDKIDAAIGQLRGAAQTEMGPATPLFIVADIAKSVAHYEERLGFDCRMQAPPEKPFFAIVGRASAQIMLKAIAPEVPPLPNTQRHEWARWDAFVHVADPGALAAELADRGAAIAEPLADTDDGLRGFAVADADGYVLFFGRPR